MTTPAATQAQLPDFLRVYYAETAGNTTARIAYLRAEAWHHGQYKAKRFKNYEGFKVAKCRFLKKNRATTRLHPPPSRHYALFQKVLDTHIATPELRETYRQQWYLL